MSKRTIPGAPQSDPWKPPYYDVADAAAIQALSRGDASGDQQRRALKWIIEAGAATYDLSFRPESDRATSFAEGRRFVGLQLVKFIHLSLGALTGKPSEQG